MNARLLDIILFGASGFTGKLCISKLCHLTQKTHGNTLTWGIAGRSEDKLKSTLAECRKITGFDLSEIPIILADVYDDDSLRKMTSQARLIINCCGPYRFFGEPVVRACIETGTHQIDVTGEPGYMEMIQFKYHKAAQEKGVYIVSSCGFDSVPCDLGVVHLQQNFNGTLNSVETYLQLTEDSPVPGPYVTYATWESLIHGIANAADLVKLRKKLFKKPLPKLAPKLKPKPQIHYSKILNSWMVPFMGADRSVIQRTQRYLCEHENLRPVQVQTYQGVNTKFGLVKLMLYGTILMKLVQYECGRKLLLKYPNFFGGGVFSRENPSAEKLDSLGYHLTFYGKGWEDKNVDMESTNPMDKTMISQVSGKNPAYLLTSVIATLSAIVILTEPDDLPAGGGVFSPGAAFAKTSLIEKMHEQGIQYKIKSKL